MRLKKWASAMLCTLILLGIIAVVPSRAEAATVMKSSQEMVNVLKTMEGFSKYPYRDVAQWTVGYGTRCPDNKLAEYRANGITEAAAEKLLKEFLLTFETDVNSFAAKYNLNLSQQRFDALVSFTYNCGAAWMSEETGYMSRAVRAGEQGADIIYAMSLYSRAGGNYLEGLVRRRLSEANMYINGIYKASNMASGIPSSYKWVFLDGGKATIPYSIYGYDASNPMPISAHFSNIPTGTDEEGNVFVYALEGWYTDSGEKVMQLDDTLTNGQILYAKWVEPETPLDIPEVGELPDFPKTATVTENNVNYRTGPGTGYARKGMKNKGDKIVITEENRTGSLPWGKMSDGYWICLNYVSYDKTAVTGVQLLEEPVKTEYDSMDQMLRLEGSVFAVTYADGTVKAQSITMDMVTDYRQTGPCEATVTAQYAGYEFSFVVAVGGHMVQFVDWDGSVISAAIYAEGDPVTEPPIPERAADKIYTYIFAGWDAPVVDCCGSATYTATYMPTYIDYTVTFKNADGTVLNETVYHYGDAVTVPDAPAKPAGVAAEATFRGWDRPVTACEGNTVYTAVFAAYVPGDFDGNGSVTDEDAIYLLWHTLFEEDYPLNQNGDLDGSGTVTDEDAIYLLWHTLFAEDYPLPQNG